MANLFKAKLQFKARENKITSYMTVGILHNHAYTYLLIFYEYKHTYIHI